MKQFYLAMFFCTALGGCADLCDQLGSATPTAQVFWVEESIEYEARQAGIEDGDLRSLAEEALRSKGFTLAASESEANAILDIDMKVLDPGIGGYAGMVVLAIREPATLRASRQGVWATTVNNSLVFVTPKPDIRDYVQGNVTDALKKLIDSHPHLRAN